MFKTLTLGNNVSINAGTCVIFRAINPFTLFKHTDVLIPHKRLICGQQTLLLIIIIMYNIRHY